MQRLSMILAGLMLTWSCHTNRRMNETVNGNFEPGTFGYDLEFLRGRDDVVVLGDGNARIIVSPRYQGKVFTSTAEGLDGKSMGWINYEAFDGSLDPHMNAYGGENRLWLGPEGNRFSLFFKPGTEMSFENWVTPSAIDTEAWSLEESDEPSVRLSKVVELVNYKGTKMEMQVHRQIFLLSEKEIQDMLGVAIRPDISAVAYGTHNEITNTGEQAWTRETGAPCIWILDMFKPSSSTVVILPFNEKATGKVVTTDYFGEIPKERITITGNLVLFKADGLARGKIGISPERALPIAGSFDPENNILTVVVFDVDPAGVYLNQEWTTEKDPFSGDAVNAYNDGPLKDGSQMGPFYELESVSPAAFLAPGEKLSHRHDVFHFTGRKEDLHAMIVSLFGPVEAINSLNRTR